MDCLQKRNLGWEITMSTSLSLNFLRGKQLQPRYPLSVKEKPGIFAGMSSKAPPSCTKLQMDGFCAVVLTCSFFEISVIGNDNRPDISDKNVQPFCGEDKVN
jgi:hypothetical protein